MGIASHIAFSRLGAFEYVLGVASERRFSDVRLERRRQTELSFFTIRRFMSRSYYDTDHDDFAEPMFRSQSPLSWRGLSGPSLTPALQYRFAELDDDHESAYPTMPTTRKLLALPRTPSSPSSSSIPPVESGGLGTFPSDPKTPYEVLNVSEDITQDDLKMAYKKAALKWHPDRHSHRSEQNIAEVTRRFQLVGEAYAILGDRKLMHHLSCSYFPKHLNSFCCVAKRRQEYDRARREPRQYRNPRTSRSTASPSFRSNFFPQGGQSTGFTSTASTGGPDDLRNVDPFYLFSRLFGDIHQGENWEAYRGTEGSRRPSPTAQGGPVRESRRSGQTQLSPFGQPVFDGFDSMFSHAPFGGSGYKPFDIQENHSSAHLDRHGQLKIARSQKGVKMSKNGGFSFESHSVSGSFGGGSMDMLHSVLGGFNLGGSGSSAALRTNSNFLQDNNINHPSGQYGNPLRASSGPWGGQPETQALQDMAPQLAMQRRPSLSYEESSNSPAHFGSGIMQPWNVDGVARRGWMG